MTAAPERFRSVWVRCGHCGQKLDRAENGIRGYYVLAGGTDRHGSCRQDRIIRVSAFGNPTYLCACGKEVTVSAARVAVFAPRAYQLRRDLRPPLVNYGLSPIEPAHTEQTHMRSAAFTG